MANDWIVTWLAIEVRSRTPGTTAMPRQEQKTFGNQKDAVNFAMSLDEGRRRTAELHFGGQVAGLPIIEQMYAAIKDRTK
jgi:hypothetical protein